MLFRSCIIAAAALLLALHTVIVTADRHDCIVGSPPLCNHSLFSDPTCRGQYYETDLKAWQSMTCDYVIYDIKAKVPTKQYVVIHAGSCDTYTENIGDWAYSAIDVNLFGLRPCLGIDYGRCSINGECDALHVSWTYPNQSPLWGLGFNPPPLVKYASDPAARLLFVHEYDGKPTYPWGASCNKTQPAYICVYSDEPAANFDRKFYGTPGSKGIQALLSQLSNSEYMPCKVEVIDARPSAAVPGTINGPRWGKYYVTNRFADKPCSGMFPANVNFTGWAWEIQGYITAGIKAAILNQQDTKQSPRAGVLGAIAQAMEVALSD